MIRSKWRARQAVAPSAVRQLIPLLSPPLSPVSDSYPYSLKSLEKAQRIDSALLSS
jgi:hypothetical protein